MIPVASKPKNAEILLQGQIHQFSEDLYAGKIQVKKEF